MKKVLWIGGLVALAGCQTALPEPEFSIKEVPPTPALLASVQVAVKRELKDPDSAKFRDLQTMGVNGSILVCGMVNSKNGSGGYAGFTPFIAKANGTTVERVILDSSDRVLEVSKECSKGGINLS